MHLSVVLCGLFVFVSSDSPYRHGLRERNLLKNAIDISGKLDYMQMDTN